MMPQGLLPFQMVRDASQSSLTALGGLLLYLDLSHVARLRDSITHHVRARRGQQGWTDAQMVLSLMLMQLAGGESVDDLRVLEGECGVPPDPAAGGVARTPAPGASSPATTVAQGAATECAIALGGVSVPGGVP